MHTTIRLVALGIVSLLVSAAKAEDFYLADGAAWPGRLLVAYDREVHTVLVRPRALPDSDVPRVQSVTLLPGGRLVFASGLDRSVYVQSTGGEQRLNYGGGLVRQVRTDFDGTLYWSGLETPLDGNPLPDGFIYSKDLTTGETRTVLTFSQSDVGRDWWGAFDVRSGRIFVGTLRGRTTIYDVSASPVERVCSLPIAATAFRFAADGSLYAADGRGKLYRFADPADPESSQVVLRTAAPFVDFELGSR